MSTVELVERVQQKPEANLGLAQAVQAFRELRKSFEHESLGTTLPSPFLLGTLRHRRFRVNTGIPVEVVRDGDTLVLCAMPLEEYGYGANFAEALEDLQRTIVELFTTLRHDEARLGPDLQRIYASLCEYVTDTTL